MCVAGRSYYSFNKKIRKKEKQHVVIYWAFKRSGRLHSSEKVLLFCLGLHFPQTCDQLWLHDFIFVFPLKTLAVNGRWEFIALNETIFILQLLYFLLQRERLRNIERICNLLRKVSIQTWTSCFFCISEVMLHWWGECVQRYMGIVPNGIHRCASVAPGFCSVCKTAHPCSPDLHGDSSSAVVPHVGLTSEWRRGLRVSLLCSARLFVSVCVCLEDSWGWDEASQWHLLIPPPLKSTNTLWICAVKCAPPCMLELRWLSSWCWLSASSTVAPQSSRGEGIFSRVRSQQFTQIHVLAAMTFQDHWKWLQMRYQREALRKISKGLDRLFLLSG